MCKNVIITFLLLISYTLILGHNLVPHQHEEAAVAAAHKAGPHHHHGHEHQQEHANKGHADSNKPHSNADHFLGDHQHAFADNKIHQLSTQATFKLTKKPVYPVLMCFLAFQYHLSRIPDCKPHPPAFHFPPAYYLSWSLSLRGPPVA